MSYTLCTGCEVELRQADAYACDCCWREAMGKSPRVEWRKFSDQVDVIPPSRNCDYCHRRNFKWLARATVCNSCYFKENRTFKEDVTNTLKFLRELHPSPWSKDFKGDVTFVVTGGDQSRDPSPLRGDKAHHDAAPDSNHDHQQQPGSGKHSREPSGGNEPAGSHPQQHHQESAGTNHERHHERPWAEAHKRAPVRIQAHRFILASKSSVFRKMFETEVKEKLEAEMKERMRQLEMSDHDQEHSAEMKKRHHHKKHGDDHDHAAEIKEKPEPGVIRLEGVGSSIVRAVINFMYTAEIKFTDKIKPVEVLRFAHEYDIPWLKNVCESELAKKITVKNLSEVLRLSYRWEAENLKKAARKFFEEHPDVHNNVLDTLLSSGS